MPRTRAKRRAEADELPADPTPPKRQTLGQFLLEERQDVIENAQEEDLEPFQVYEKEQVIADRQAEESDPDNDVFKGVLYTTEGGTNLLFLTLPSQGRPSEMTHICNKSTLKWNTRGVGNEGGNKIPSVALIFVRGAFVQETTLTSDKYLYLGTKGRGSMRIYTVADGPAVVTFHLDDDLKIGKKQLELLGKNCLKCKKNRYGATLCSSEAIDIED